MNRWITMVGLMIGMLAVAYWTSSTWLEIAATTTGLLSVWLTARQNIWCWPVGLVNVGCFFFMFFDAKLYADMTLQVFFFALSLQGWIVWLTNRQGAAVRPTTRISRRTAVGLGIALLAATSVWGYVLTRYTDASIPYLDAFIATLSVLAQFLLSSKKLENWYLWFAVDVMSVGMYAYKGLYSVAFLYLIYLGIVVSGWYGWKREYDAWRGGFPAQGVLPKEEGV